MKLSEFNTTIGSEEIVWVVAESSTIHTPMHAPIVVIPSCREGWDALFELPYALVPQKLLEEGTCRVVTFMSPHHGQRIKDGMRGEIAGFAEAVASGGNPFLQYVNEATHIVTEIINHYGPTALFTFGGSRTGHLALMHASFDSRICGVAATAPVTDWRRLTEFNNIQDNAVMKEQELIRCVDQLKNIPIFLVIGNNDERVSTTTCVKFFAALLSDNDSAKCFLNVVEADGHSLPDIHWQSAAEFILKHLPEKSQSYERCTPIFSRHGDAHAQMGVLHQWRLPEVYSKSVEEDLHFYQHEVSLMDIPYRGLIWIRGESALVLVRSFFGEEAARLDGGRGILFEINNSESGALISIGKIYAYNQQNFCVRVDAPCRDELFELLRTHNQYKAILEDHSKCFVTLGVYGEGVSTLMKKLPWEHALDDIAENSLRDVSLGESSWIVERVTTPRNGFEISGNRKYFSFLWDQLKEHGAHPVGYKVLDSHP